MMLMKLFIVMLGAFLVSGLRSRFLAHQQVIPSRGEVWPLAAYERKESRIFVVTPSFQIKISNNSCPLVQQAVKRYETIYAHRLAPPEFEIPLKRKFGSKIFDKLDYLYVVLTGPCEERPYIGMNESYRLWVSVRSKLTSYSVWGILRGLETFAHLFYLHEDYKTILIRSTEIRDSPHYPYRGLLLDTARHYIAPKKILMTLGAMAMNKMNVLHWHLTNDESFPFQSDLHPELSEKGAYYSSLVYTAADIAKITEYARQRGIIVIPEISLPGHCASIYKSHPELQPMCLYASGALNPAKEQSFKLAADLMVELQERFPTNHVYFGAMNVDMVCWKDDDDTRKLMSTFKLTTRDLLNLTYQNIIRSIKPGTVPIAWQDLWEQGYSVPNNTIFSVYRLEGVLDMVRILRQGYRGILSIYYNLTDEAEGYNEYYVDPLMNVRAALRDNDLVHNLLGGEFMAWTPYIDNGNIINEIWPYASGFAEALWGETWFHLPPLRARLTPVARAEEHACRMKRRGLHVAPPVGPGFCVF